MATVVARNMRPDAADCIVVIS